MSPRPHVSTERFGLRVRAAEWLLGVALAAGSTVASAAPSMPDAGERGRDAGERVVAYHAEGLRDPMKSLLPQPRVTQPTQTTAGKPAASKPPERPLVSLQGMFWGSTHPYTIINDDVYEVGDQVGGAKILSIAREGVTVQVGDQQFVLTPTKGDPKARATGGTAQRSARQEPPRTIVRQPASEGGQ